MPYLSETAQYILTLTPKAADYLQYALTRRGIDFNPDRCLIALDPDNPPDHIFVASGGNDAIRALNNLLSTLNECQRGGPRLPFLKADFDALPRAIRYEVLRIANYTVDWSSDPKHFEPQDYTDSFFATAWLELEKVLPEAFSPDTRNLD